MEIMNQGSDYKEEQVEVLEESKPKIPKKLILIASGILVIGIIAITAFGLNKSAENKAKAREAQQQSEEIPEEELIMVEYTPEELTTLRNWGYTGNEIEEFQNQQASVDYLVEQARAGREEVLATLYPELNKNAQKNGTREYKSLLNNTWLGGKTVKVHADDPNVFETSNIKDNVDYIKLPSRGKQLFVKLTLSDGTNLFYNIHPTRYQELKNKGNMVVTYDTIKFGDQQFIDNLMEVTP